VLRASAPPGTPAAIMGTGIVSVALELDGASVASAALLVVALVLAAGALALVGVGTAADRGPVGRRRPPR